VVLGDDDDVASVLCHAQLSFVQSEKENAGVRLRSQPREGTKQAVWVWDADGIMHSTGHTER
jgi:hypothetical protein